VDDDVVATTIGEDNLSKMHILIIRMAHSSPKGLWPSEAKNGKIPATQEARYFVASITVVGPYYKARSSAATTKKLTQQKLQWDKGTTSTTTSTQPNHSPSPAPSNPPTNSASAEHTQGPDGTDNTTQPPTPSATLTFGKHSTLVQLPSTLA